MGAILKVRDTEGTVHEIYALQGKSAYQYAVEGGYTGTEAEFAAKLAEEMPTVDDTLTQSGQAADAKAVGDAINLLSKEIAGLQGALSSYITDVAELVGGDA